MNEIGNNTNEPLIGSSSQVDPEAGFMNPSAGPPLRRMTTSQVNRRRLEEMNQRETQQKYMQKHLGDFLWFSCLTAYYFVCYYLPDIFGGERDPNCKMRTAFANAMFGWTLTLPQAVFHLCFIIGFAIKKRSTTPQGLQDYI